MAEGVVQDGAPTAPGARFHSIDDASSASGGEMVAIKLAPADRTEPS